MNKGEIKRLDKIEVEVRNNTKQLERLITNDLPHLMKEVARNTGKLTILIPLMVGVFLLIIGIAVKIMIG